MTSKKDLKKVVKHICSELLTDCVALSLCDGKPIDGLDDIAADIIQTNNDYVKRLSHVEKGSERVFFKKYRQEFIDHVNELSHKIEELFVSKAGEE
ncbi:MAG: hypothetical protein IJ553_02140 [Alloprevotella sp.]|nr:hypothetical protein [Alloprevotella sp.]